MKALRTVNMIWERRYRGTYPVSRYALGDDGTVVLALPRPLEVRAYDLTRLRLDGAAETRCGFAVETLLKLEVTPLADAFLGMTSDDIYVFHANGKQRFMDERRISYVDAALSADGQRVAAGFSDIAGASYALAFGEIGGRVAWTRDVDVPLSAVAIARDGSRIAFSAEEGTLWLADALRRDVWQFGQEEPIRALACSQDGAFTAYGTANGAIGLIDAEGSRRWEARVQGEVVALALSGDGALCAALVRPADDSAVTQILCLVGEGQVGWDYWTEKRLLGLSLSANGRFLATGGRDGTTAVYEVVPGEVQITATGKTAAAVARTQAEAQANAGDLESACRTLRSALDADPADVELCTTYTQQHTQWLETRLAQVKAHSEQGDFAAAIALLKTMRQEDPRNAVTLTLLIEMEVRRAAQLLAEAQAQEATGNAEAAETALLEAIAADPTLLEARRALATLRAHRAQAAEAEAEALLARGDLEAGVAALEKVQALAPSAETAQKLARAQTAHEFSAGLALYNQKRYQEAIFQFRKALARDPEHTEAQRYLNYAQKFAQDSQTADLSDRFSRLE